MTSIMSCWWWWLALGALGGWLLSWWLTRRVRRAHPSVDRIVEKFVDRPVDRVVEKQIDNPVHLSRIGELETQVALIAGLRSRIQTLEAMPPKTVDKVVEKIVEKPVDRVVERLVDNPAHLTRIRGLEDELRLLRDGPGVVDQVAAKAAGFSVKGIDDLEIIEGIGPKIAELLHADGVHTFAQLSHMLPAQIQAILDKAGPKFALARPDTWPEQSELAARNRWQALRALQDVLNAGKRE